MQRRLGARERSLGNCKRLYSVDIVVVTSPLKWNLKGLPENSPLAALVLTTSIAVMESRVCKVLTASAGEASRVASYSTIIRELPHPAARVESDCEVG